MKRLSTMIAGLVVTAGLLLAAGIDGKWAMDGAATKKGTQKLTLNLKANGAKLEGDVEGMGRKGAGVAIQDGKLDGNKFSFTTTVNSKKKGDQKVIWQGTVEGDELKGTRMRDGAARSQSFTAKRGS